MIAILNTRYDGDKYAVVPQQFKSYMSDITFKMTVATNVGLVRSNNEDNFIVCPDLSVKNNWFVPSDPNDVMYLGELGCVMVVADGMGGMNAGEVASELAVTSIKQSFSEVKDFSKIIDASNHVEDFMKKIIVKADAVIKQKVKEDESTSGMGTTIVMAWVVDNVAHIAWCGDSRAYLFNCQSGLSRLSNDHSYVQELVDTGKLDPELAFDHPNSNIITRSLGDSPNKARPDYVCKKLSVGDYLLLCTDGLCGLCRDEEILDIMMKEYPSIDDYKMKLFEAAFEAGGYDNVTIALFECMSVKEANLATTAPPDAPKRRKAKPQPKPEAEEESVEGGTKKKSRGWLKTLIVLVVLLIAAGAAYYYYEYIYKLQATTEEVSVPVTEEVTVDAPMVDALETVEAPEATELAEPKAVETPTNTEVAPEATEPAAEPTAESTEAQPEK